jgi:hypothetical protein
VLVDPMRASGRFFDELIEVPQWYSKPAWDTAQAVQDSPSSNGEIYRASYPRAATIVAELTAPDSGRPAGDEPPIDGGLCTPIH